MSSDAERVAELEAEVERLNDALDAADVRYRMLGEWGERRKAEAEHLRTYAEKQDELIHRLRVRAETAEAEIEQWRESDATLMSLVETWKPRAEAAEAKIAEVRALAVDQSVTRTERRRRILMVLDGEDRS